MIFMSKQLVPTVEHTYAKYKEVHAGYGHSGECFLVGYMVSRCKGYKQGSAWLIKCLFEHILLLEGGLPTYN
jgi:hypothetical protein